MILEIFNWIASFLIVWGTIEVSHKKSNLLLVNILYTISSAIMIMVFTNYENWAMVFMYIVLIVISTIGIKQHWKKEHNLSTKCPMCLSYKISDNVKVEGLWMEGLWMCEKCNYISDWGDFLEDEM